ncbi:MAG: hypothetical protein ACK4QW_15000 [Alphaproteobacteria bacterium]
MTRIPAAGAVLALTLAVSAVTEAVTGAASAQTQPPGGQAQRFKPVDIVDPSGFERPMPAARIVVPAHWQAQGGVVWNPQTGCQADATQFAWAAGAPGGVDAVEIIPGTGWEWNDLPAQYRSQGGQAPAGCANAAIRSAREYLETLVHMRRPGAVVLDYRERPDLIRELGFDKPLHQNQMPGLEQRMWGETGEILIGYRLRGWDIRETMVAGVLLSVTRMAGVMPGEIWTFFGGTSLPAFAMRAPDGALDFRLAETIRKSFSVNPDWQARMNRSNAEMARIAAKGAADRSRITADTNREISDIINQGWRDRQAMMEKGHERFSRAIRGQEQYHDPDASGQRVELPNTYNHAWRLQDGTYLMTDNPSFDPYRDLGVDGRQLEVMR